MFDIVKCEAGASEHGFDKFYFFDSVKGRIIHAKNLQEAAEHRNKKALIMLDNVDFDIGSVKLIAEKKKACFLMDLGALIKSHGITRAVSMSRLRTFLRLCNKYGAFYAFASFAKSEQEIRNPDELMHIAMLLEINKGQARFGLKMLHQYLQ